MQEVQDIYRIPGSDGGITHVVIPPETREVLSKVRSLPGRRIAGDKALQFINNPYPYLGENATAVLPPESFERSREEAEIYFHRFRLLPRLDMESRIKSVDIEFEEISIRPVPPSMVSLKNISDLRKFAYELKEKQQSRLAVSPKLNWLLKALGSIRESGEKVIIFTELRDIQRMLQQALLARFGLYVTVVNGDTSTSSEKGTSRQKLIDAFQAQPGFGVIILSTTAVGFGVNVQAANHVIHFTRPWNPAKEDQATDRAYRIGQTKDVVVYYPTVICNGFASFEERLDQLLENKRSLASDMLNGCDNIDIMQLGMR